jgi:hypothetical protein
LIDKILDLFGLVRAIEHWGRLYPANNCNIAYPNGESSLVTSAWGKFPSSQRKIVRKSTLALNQAMRCL